MTNHTQFLSDKSVDFCLWCVVFLVSLLYCWFNDIFIEIILVWGLQQELIFVLKATTGVCSLKLKYKGTNVS